MLCPRIRVTLRFFKFGQNALNEVLQASHAARDGNFVTIGGINGNPTLDLVNIRTSGKGISNKFGNNTVFFGITACRDIKNSRIRLEGGTGKNNIYGIGE